MSARYCQSRRIILFISANYFVNLGEYCLHAEPAGRRMDAVKCDVGDREVVAPLDDGVIDRIALREFISAHSVVNLGEFFCYLGSLFCESRRILL